MAEKRIVKKTTAAKSSSRKKAYTLSDENSKGQIQVADDVLATIVSLAATEVEGVASMGGGITHDKASRAGARALSKAVKCDVLEGVVSIRAILNMRYGYNIPETCKKVQKKIKTVVEEMTALEVADVAVSVADVAVEAQKKAAKKTVRKTAKKSGS